MPGCGCCTRLTHLSDPELLGALTSLLAQERAALASVLAHLGEVDARRLYLAEGFPSMYAYCVEGLRLSEDAACLRIQAARAGRRFPALLQALEEGTLHVSAVVLLAPHVTPETVEGWIREAAGRTKKELERRLAAAARTRSALPSWMPNPVSVLERIVDPACASPIPAGPGSGAKSEALGEAAAGGAATRAVTEARFELRVTIRAATQAKLARAQALLSHAVPSGDLGAVLDRALEVLLEQLERRKLGALSGRPTGACPPPRPSARPGARGIPAHVRRSVWARDGGQCAFVSAQGRRCSARRFLEFDHARPVARGGAATVENVRLRCRAHNQLEAERLFGRDFMEARRASARSARAERKFPAPTAAGDRDPRHQEELRAVLRTLGCRGEEARRAADSAAALPPGTPLEAQVRAALQRLGSKARRSGAE